MNRAYYSDTIERFLASSEHEILGRLTAADTFDTDHAQKDAWIAEIRILRSCLKGYDGHVSLEYSIPRLGKRIDALLVIESVVFVVEFKVGEKTFHRHAIDQVHDYALDLKNFHSTSHDKYIAPILVATSSTQDYVEVMTTPKNDGVLEPVLCGVELLPTAIDRILDFCEAPTIDITEWEGGMYSPTPSIIEAARALYSSHSVADITRKDAGGEQLEKTTEAVSSVIGDSIKGRFKSICFVTGVPGAGKTLVGLDIANRNRDETSEAYSVYLSGNGPLVQILCEALARDAVAADKVRGKRTKLSDARRAVSRFIQNVHHFRDEGIKDPRAPIEHVAIFDEAQRAWNANKTSRFMRTRKGFAGWDQAESAYLISCLDRHDDWAVVVCLVGGGQEIYDGEAGIGEWVNSICDSFADWHVYMSDRLTDSEYDLGEAKSKLETHPFVTRIPDLHLGVSMRSYRAENVSLLVKQLLDLDRESAQKTFRGIDSKFPIFLTRDLVKAKQWLREQARGNERFGMVASSRAERLKPLAVNVKSPVNPIHWFLEGKDDVRSSFYLEDVTTEFQIQGLELDWACVTWDGDFRFAKDHWDTNSFRGNKWQRVRSEANQHYLKNAYRVLLTRARQGMIIFVPEGDRESEGDRQDKTRLPKFYDGTFEYLKSIGFKVI